ncbi:hypothetical protein PY254_16095 [Rhodanobacter sp. AS-Z3]|uniref:hypothetical protein n=1 Tax=Rhodanobacter sp. AS-Z3 TaxID=3031330 RepID=UPI002478FB86|nr:hypothetical protein [Rhodanobacter sp. AS-Z3]WEN14734.1 hypothetical protein PY254_16095 [Rhodanobacter sp. AS-Z3]
MNVLHRVLLAPWIASPRSSRWLVVMTFVVALAGAVVTRISTHGARPWLLSVMVLGAGNALCWLLLMPNCLFLAIAARHLRMPGITRDVSWSMPLYAVLVIGVPMVLQLPQGNVMAFAVVQLLVAARAMLYMLLPAYAGILLCLLPALHAIARHLVALPGIADPRFVSWCGGLVVLLLLLLAWRWHQLLHGEIPTSGLRAPGLINLRRNMGRAQSDPLTDATLLRRRPAWLIARVDLSDVGLRAPVQSLRVALGGGYLPQTAAGRLIQLAVALLAMLAVGLLLFAVTMGDNSGGQFLHYLLSREGFTYEAWVFGAFSVGASAVAVEFLLLRWERVNAELPLLALLPGLSGNEDIKRLLLRTAIQRPAGYIVGLLLMGWLWVAGYGYGWVIGWAMLVVSLASLGYLYTMVLGIFAGRPLSALGKALLIVALFTLSSLTLLLPPLWHDWSALSEANMQTALGFSWLLLTLFLCWLGRRGWQGLQQRPHPFIPN